MYKFIDKNDEFERLEYPLKQQLFFTCLGTFTFNDNGLFLITNLASMRDGSLVAFYVIANSLSHASLLAMRRFMSAFSTYCSASETAAFNDAAAFAAMVASMSARCCAVNSGFRYAPDAMLTVWAVYNAISAGSGGGGGGLRRRRRRP